MKYKFNIYQLFTLRISSALYSFLVTWVPLWYHFSSAGGTYFNFSCTTILQEFSQIEKCYLNLKLLDFKTFKISFHCFLAAIVSDLKKSSVICAVVLLHVMCSFSMATLNIFSLSSFFSNVTMIWLEVISFVSVPFVLCYFQQI